MSEDREAQKLRDDLDKAAAIVSRAGNWMAKYRGLNDRGYFSYEQASEGINGLLSRLPSTDERDPVRRG